MWLPQKNYVDISLGATTYDKIDIVQGFNVLFLLNVIGYHKRIFDLQLIRTSVNDPIWLMLYMIKWCIVILICSFPIVTQPITYHKTPKPHIINSSLTFIHFQSNINMETINMEAVFIKTLIFIVESDDGCGIIWVYIMFVSWTADYEYLKIAQII